MVKVTVTGSNVFIFWGNVCKVNGVQQGSLSLMRIPKKKNTICGCMEGISVLAHRALVHNYQGKKMTGRTLCVSAKTTVCVCIKIASLSNKRIWGISWPACISDMSATENIWHMVKWKICQRRSRSVAQLKSYIKRDWQKNVFAKIEWCKTGTGLSATTVQGPSLERRIPASYSKTHCVCVSTTI